MNIGNKSDVLKGKSLHFKEETDKGQVISIAKDINNWFYQTQTKTEIKLSETETMRGTVTQDHNGWQEYLQKTKGFYFEDCEVSFTVNIKRRGRKDGSISVTKYWVAQKRVNGKLYRSYVCKLDDLDHSIIVSASEKLMHKIGVSTQ